MTAAVCEIRFVDVRFPACRNDEILKREHHKEHALSDTVNQLLRLSQQMLDSIDQQDWSAYCQLCDPSLTAFEPEAVGNRVCGMDFHEFYFKIESAGRPKQSTISSPDVRLMGDSAVVTYVRLTQRVDDEGRSTTSAQEETRIWQRQNGEWKHVHFHRSNSGHVRL